MVTASHTFNDRLDHGLASPPAGGETARGTPRRHQGLAAAAAALTQHPMLARGASIVGGAVLDLSVVAVGLALGAWVALEAPIVGVRIVAAVSFSYGLWRVARTVSEVPAGPLTEAIAWASDPSFVVTLLFSAARRLIAAAAMLATFLRRVGRRTAGLLRRRTGTPVHRVCRVSVIPRGGVRRDVDARRGEWHPQDGAGDGLGGRVTALAGSRRGERRCRGVGAGSNAPARIARESAAVGATDPSAAGSGRHRGAVARGVATRASAARTLAGPQRDRRADPAAADRLRAVRSVMAEPGTTTVSSSTCRFRVHRIAILAGHRDTTHHALMNDLRAAISRVRGLRSAFLASVRYGRNVSPVLALCVTATAEMRGEILARLSQACERSDARFGNLDVLVMTDAQAVRLARNCRPFFVFHPGYMKV